MTWRDTAAPIIKEVIERVGRDDPGRLKRELFDAYPFGERKYHPYKVWLHEIKRQLGTVRKKKLDPNQMDMFNINPKQKEKHHDG